MKYLHFGSIKLADSLKENVLVGRLIPAGTGYFMSKIKDIARGKDYEIELAEASINKAREDQV